MNALPGEVIPTTARAVPPGRGLVLLLLAALTAAGAALRAVNAGESLWLDELVTAWAVADGLGEVGPRALWGNTLPTYHYLVWLSTAWLGPTELATRLPSLVFGVLVIPASYLLARRLADSVAVGLLAAALVAFDGLCIHYASTARTYSLLQLISLVHLTAFWRVFHAPRFAPRLVFAASLVLLFYLHFTGVLILLGEIAFYVAAQQQGWTPAYRPRQFAADLAIAAIGWIPGLPVMAAIASRRGAWKLMVEQVHLEDLLTVFPLAPYLLLPLTLAALLGSFIRPDPRADRLMPVIGPRPLFFLFCAHAVPLLTAWLIARMDLAPLFHGRFTLVAYLPLILGCALVAMALPTRPSRAVFLVAAVLLAQSTEGPFRKLHAGNPYPRFSREDWKHAIAHLNAMDTDPRWPVFLRSGLIETDALLAAGDDPTTKEYLTCPVRSLYLLSHPERPVEPLRFDGSFAGDWQPELIRDAGGAWFLVKANSGLADYVIRAVQGRMKQLGLAAAVEDRLDLANVVVFRIRSRPL